MASSSKGAPIAPGTDSSQEEAVSPDTGIVAPSNIDAVSQPCASSCNTGASIEGKHAGESGDAPPNKISKNQLKRQRKWAQAMAIKKRRKTQEKEIRHAKAEAEGRDIDTEKRIMEENRKSGAGWIKREEKWKQRFDRDSSRFQICVDCSFEDQMTERETNSLGIQLRYCYSHNKQTKHPVVAKVTSLSGTTLDCLKNVAGFDQWANRAFEHTSQDLLEAFPDKSKLVYLTSDSENTLDTLQDGKVYIIGGIVDRNRLKRATINRAEKLGIATAKLPIAEHFDLVATKVLTVNHVFEILVRLREHDNDWKKTLLAILPERKDANQKQVEQPITASSPNLLES